MGSKKLLLTVAVVLVAVLIAFNPFADMPAFAATQESMAVQVPDAINNAIAIGVTALVALGVAYVLKATGLDLTQISTPLAVTISAFIVTELQNIINMVPESYDPTLNIVFKIIVVLLGSVGLLWMRKPAPPTEPYNPSLLA